MRRVIFTGLFYFIVVISFGQKRQLNKIISKINEGEFIESNEKLNEIALKEGNIPEVAFVRYLFYIKRKQSSDDLDSAYFYFRMAYEGLGQTEAKEKEKLCKDFEFCEGSKSVFFSALEYDIFQSYSEARSKERISVFQKKYSESEFFSQSVHLIDSLDYVQVKNKTDKSVLYDYIKTHPESAFNETVRQHIYAIAFEEAKKDGSIPAFEFFIKNYEKAPQRITADSLLMEATWSSIKNKGIIEDYEKFIRRFPNSAYQIQANENMEGIAWKNAETINTASAYKELYTRYPNAKNAELARRKYDELRDNVVPYFTKEKKYKLYDLDNKKFVSDEEYDHIAILDKGKFIVSKFKKFGVINKSGQILIPITYNCIQSNQNYLNIKLGDKMACYDLEGNKIIDFLYDGITLYDKIIKADIYKTEQQSVWQHDIYDFQGEKILSGKYESFEVINDTLFNVSQNKKHFLINRNQKPVSAKFSSLSTQTKGLFIVVSEGKYGIMDLTGKMIIPALYENIISTDSSSFFILSNKTSQMALIDQKGNFLINFQAKEIIDLNGGMFLLVTSENRNSENEDAILFNARKKATISGKYEWVNSFEKGIAIAGKNGKSGFIDTDGTWIISPLYSTSMRVYYEDGMGGPDGDEDMYFYEDEDLENPECNNQINSRNKQNFEYNYSRYGQGTFSDNLAPVTIDTLSGYVNLKGEIVIPIIYSYAEPFFKGITNVTLYQNGEYVQQVIDQNGKVLLDHAQIYVYFENNTKALLSRNMIFGVQGEEEYYVCDLSNKNVQKIKIEKGHTNILPMSEYFISNYKDLNIVVMPDGSMLMDKNIDFSNYDFKQSVLKVNDIYNKGLYDEAITEYEKLLKQRPQSYSVHYMLAQCYLQKESDYYYNYYLGKAIDIRPDKLDLRRTRMDWNYEKSNWREVINDASKLIENYTYIDDNVYFKRAYSYDKLGYDNEALNDYTTIINNSKYCMAYNNRGHIYYKSKRYSNALEDFNNAIKNSPSYDKTNLDLMYCNKGNALYYLGRKTEACAAWRMSESLGYSAASTNISNFCR